MEQRLIFVIDDYPGIRRLVETELQAIGWAVDTFREATEAAAAVRRGRRPALVLVDPWGDSDQASPQHELLGLTQPASMIVMSGARTTAALAEQRGLPVLWKPFEATALLDAVRNVLPETPQLSNC